MNSAGCNYEHSAATALRNFMRSTVMAIGIFGAALIGGHPTRGTAEESYPWCTQGSLLHCYYMTREQCEQTVDYHGFCVPNPDVSPSNNEAARHPFPPQ